MKATELQIGDWVDSSFFGKTRVTSLKEYVGYGWVMTLGNENWKSDVSLSPIPLTSEILEKNGFKYVDVYKVYERHTFGKHIELDYSEGMVCGISISVTDKNAVNTSNIDIARDRNIYVHEMQQCLRLCGLEELADNFKV